MEVEFIITRGSLPTPCNNNILKAHLKLLIIANALSRAAENVIKIKDELEKVHFEKSVSDDTALKDLSQGHESTQSVRHSLCTSTPAASMQSALLGRA